MSSQPDPPDAAASPRAPDSDAEAARQPASELLEALADAFPNETVSVGDVLDRLDGRAFGLLLLLLAAPMCIPNLPGISTIFGVILVAPAVQMILGSRKPWLPTGLRLWSFQREHLRAAIRGAAPILKRVERFVQPRWTWALKSPFTILLGVQTLFLAIILILPIPFGNFGPAIVIAATALAFLQDDGVLAMATPVLTVAATALAWVGIQIGLKAVEQGWHILAGALGF